MRRVVFVNRVFHPDTSATSRLLSDLAGTLSAGRPVLVVCSRTCRVRGDELGENLRVLRLPWGRRGAPGLLRRAVQDGFFMLAMAAVLLWMLRKPDLVVAKSDPPMLHAVVALVARLRGCLHIGWHQDLYPEVAMGLDVVSGRSLPARALLRWRDWALRDAACNVAIGREMEKYLGRRGRVALFANWALNETAANPAEVASFRNELGWGERCVVAHCGNLGRVHPLAPLISLQAAYPPDSGVSFLISGGGHHYDRLRQQVGDAVNWRFLPFQPEERLAVLLAAADVHLVLLDPRLARYVVPSKLVGVLAAGRPCLFIGDVDSEAATVLRDFGCGYSFAPSDERGLAGAIVELRANPGLRSRMGRAARKAYEECYSGRLAIGRWKALLDQVDTGQMTR